jgi:molybdopterin-guanine dinucleotide biosynthesis protein A
LDISCIVLAGGKSKRLGRNKVVEMIGGQSLLERVVSKLSYFKTDIIVVAAKDSALPEITDYPGVKVVQDIYPGKGSLGGIYTGLKYSQSFSNLVVAGDMPFLNLELLGYMLDVMNGFDAVVPRVSQTIFEPLHAAYSKKCVSYLEQLILENKFMILELYPLVKVKYIEISEIDRFDPRHLSFFNVNTESDLVAGRELERKGDV